MEVYKDQVDNTIDKIYTDLSIIIGKRFIGFDDSVTISQRREAIADLIVEHGLG